MNKLNSTCTEQNRSIPALRFPEFMGEWEKKKLGDISEKINSGKTPLGGENVYTENGILFIRSQNVLENRLSYENSTYIPEEINNTMKNSVVKPKDILLNITGASLGRSCVVPDDFSVGNVNQHVCIIRIDKENNPYFIQPIFSSSKGQNLFTSLQTGSGREGLNFQSIRQIELLFPTLPEQTRIASFLTSVDQKLTQLKQKKTLLEKYKKGVMQKIFSQELRFKDENGKEFPKWEGCKIGDIASLIKDGTHGTHKECTIGNYFLLSAKNVDNGIIKIDESDRRICKEDYDSIYRNYNLRNGDILLTIVGTIGRSAIWKDKVDNIAFQRSVAFFRFDEQFPEFIFQLFNSELFQKELLQRQVTSAQPGIYLGDLAKITIKLPCFTEQTKIANFLSAIDEKINHCQTQIEKTEGWKKGLLQMMFV